MAEKEQAAVERWREKTLLEAGFTPEDARTMALCRDIDVHEALTLVEQGCSPRLAAEILL